MTWTPEFRVPSASPLNSWFSCLYLPSVEIIGMPHCKQLFGCWGLNPGFHACYKKHRINWTISPSLTSLLLRKEIPNKLACRSYRSSLMQTFRLRPFGLLGPMCFALLLGSFLIYSTLTIFLSLNQWCNKIHSIKICWQTLEGPGPSHEWLAKALPLSYSTPGGHPYQSLINDIYVSNRYFLTVKELLCHELFLCFLELFFFFFNPL